MRYDDAHVVEPYELVVRHKLWVWDLLSQAKCVDGAVRAVDAAGKREDGGQLVIQCSTVNRRVGRCRACTVAVCQGHEAHDVALFHGVVTMHEDHERLVVQHVKLGSRWRVTIIHVQ